METKVPDLTPPTKKAAKAPKEPGAPKAEKAPKPPKAEGEGTGSANPRPRQWDYGIAPEATIEQVPGVTPKVRKDTLDVFNKLTTSMTIEAFQAAGATRHDIRVLCRSGLVKITSKDGKVYPVKL